MSSLGWLAIFALYLLLFSLLHSCDLEGSSFLPRGGTSAFGSSSGTPPAYAGTGDPSAQPEGAYPVASGVTASAPPTGAPLEVIPDDRAATDTEPFAVPTREHPAELLIPAHNAGWSGGIALPLSAAGDAYALCRSASLGNDTLLVQYRKDTGGWMDFVSGADGREERYQSAADAQTVTYYFVPAAEAC